jgi:hypothetical protein
LEHFPLARKVIVGRNSVFAIEVESDNLFGWGSNRYGQIFPSESLKGLLKVTNSKFRVEEREDLISSSYFSLFLTKRSQVNLCQEVEVIRTEK